MNMLNNLEVLNEMEALEATNEQKKNNDEFPFLMDMNSFWKSLVGSIESRFGKLKINRKLYRFPIKTRRVRHA